MSERIERDTIGEIAVPAERLWGAQTERSRRNFRISGERMLSEAVPAPAYVKKAVARIDSALIRPPRSGRGR